MIERARSQISRRFRQSRDILSSEGTRGITMRAQMAMSRWLQPQDALLEVRREDIIQADLSRPFVPPVQKVRPGESIIVNWVMVPPSRGSGGATTQFRIINYLQAQGYTVRIYFHDVYRGDRKYYESIVRDYYKFHGSIDDVDNGMQDAHAVMASAWTTAYPVFNSRCAGKRFYFVQDFEPSFYPAGSFSFLADNTYRMGFHAITAGAWLAQKLADEYGMAADSFDFGCDTTRYKRADGPRSGVVFYARPEAARRAFELGVMALEVFASHCPDIEIHLYGKKMGSLAFNFHDHGHVTPDRLNEIYNSSYAGLSLSTTNVSLVPHEMLASGCIPVVNEGIQNRIVLDNPFVRYATMTPHALSAAMETIVRTPDFASLSMEAAASVTLCTWEGAGAKVDAIMRRALA